MVEVKWVDSLNSIFKELTNELDLDLRKRYGEKQDELDVFNRISESDPAIVVLVDGKPAGCGCFREFNCYTVEMKRFYVRPEFRGTGIALLILIELENLAKEKDYTGAILETGCKQLEALRFYSKTGYKRIENYGQYTGRSENICMGKSFAKSDNNL